MSNTCPAPVSAFGRPTLASAMDPSVAATSQLTTSQLKQSLQALILERGYEFREQPFQLSSGGSSHDYVDMRRAVARGADLELAARALASSLAEAGLEYDAIGGMTMGADPVAHAVALLTGRAWYSVRKATKEHGTGRRIEGATVELGTRVVVMEDTVSTGKSLLEAYEVVAATGAEIVAAATLLDRGETMTAIMAACGATYLAVLSYKDLGLAPIGDGGAADQPAEIAGEEATAGA
jgi:orotate phosphoribosyltransferase